MRHARPIKVRLGGDGTVEIILPKGFTRAELEVVRRLPGRRWDPRRRVWAVPSSARPLEVLAEKIGADRLVMVGESARSLERTARHPPEPKGLPRPRRDPGDGPCQPDETDPELMARVRSALILRGYSPRTIKVYLGHLRRFLEWCGGGAPAPPIDPGRQCQAYLLEVLQGREISRGYQNQLISALKFLCESVLGAPLVAPRIPRPRKEHRLPQVLSPEEVARLLARARNPKHRALLMLLYSAGLRVGEVVRLRPSDLDVERRLVRVTRGKGAKDRYTLLATKAVDAVKLYLDAYPTQDWLFPGSRPGRHLTSRTVQRVVKHVAAAAGITKPVTTHTLRHSFATHLLEGGTNLRIIQELLGHTNARTTQIYTHVAKSALEAVRSPLDNL